MADSDDRPPLFLRLRRAVQFVAAFGLNALFLYDLRGICFPALNCWACPAASFACPMGALQHAMPALRVTLLAPLYVLGTLLAVSAIIGRSMCGWLCPFGLVQDLLGRIRRRHWRPPLWLGYLKYAVLVVFGLVLPYFTYRSVFCELCPQGALQGGIFQPLLHPELRELIGSLWYVKMAILAAFLIASVFVRRPFCHSFCPLGALFSLCNRISLVRIEFIPDRCTDCLWCVRACPAGIDPRTDLGGHACVNCMECAKCPFDAIQVTTALGGLRRARKPRSEDDAP